MINKLLKEAENSITNNPMRTGEGEKMDLWGVAG